MSQPLPPNPQCVHMCSTVGMPHLTPPLPPFFFFYPTLCFPFLLVEWPQVGVDSREKNPGKVIFLFKFGNKGTGCYPFPSYQQFPFREANPFQMQWLYSKGILSMSMGFLASNDLFVWCLCYCLRSSPLAVTARPNLIPITKMKEQELLQLCIQRTMCHFDQLTNSMFFFLCG